MAGNLADGFYDISGGCALNCAAQRPETVCRGFDITVGFCADKCSGGICEGGTDQQSVSLRLGWDGFKLTVQLVWENGNVHIKDLPE